MAIVDVIDSDSGRRVRKVELLVQTAVLGDVLPNLLLHVQLTTIYLVSDRGSQMFEGFYPWQWVTTQVHVWQHSLFLQESHTFCFALYRVCVC